MSRSTDVRLAGSRVALSKTKCQVEEHVDQDEVIIWLVPGHGYFPTEDIAHRVRRKTCTFAPIRPVKFTRDCAYFKERQSND